MEGATSANEGAALPGGANECNDTEKVAANQQQDDGSAVANGDAPLHESANKGKRSCSSANQDAETQEVTNDRKETQAANEDTACKALTNEDTAHKPLTNENTGLNAQTNQDKSTPSANQDTVHQLSTNQSTTSSVHQALPLQDPTNDLTPLAATANQAQDPWDWSLEEAWLRAPEEEGLEAWGAELEGWEVEPDEEEEEEELEDWEVELMGQGAEHKSHRAGLKSQGVELESSKGQGVGPNSQGAGLDLCGVDPNSKGAELEDSRGHRVGPTSQGAGPKGQRAELDRCGADPNSQGAELEDSRGHGVGPNSQGAGPKGQRAELDRCGADPNSQGAELEESSGHGVGPKGQRAELDRCGVDPNSQGAELEESRGHGVGLKGQRAELDRSDADPNSQGVELEDSRGHGVGPNSQGAGLKGQRAELDPCVDPNSQGAELKAKWADPSAPEASHWRCSPDGAWSKLTVRAGRGLARPGPGSLCRVRLWVPRCPGAAPAALSGCGRWSSVRLGSAEGRWAALLDAGLETMAAGELAWLRPRGAPARALGVRLGRFTAAPPFWAVPPSSRWPAVTSGHARAAHLLRRGQVRAAAQAFRRSLRAAVAAAGPPPVPPAVGELKAELHAGLAAAQIRLGLPAAAAANAGKALELRPAHLGARYARGVACAAMMDLEAAREDLLAVLRARPGHAGAARELGRVRDKARQRDTQLATRLGKMFA